MKGNHAVVSEDNNRLFSERKRTENEAVLFIDWGEENVKQEKQRFVEIRSFFSSFLLLVLAVLITTKHFCEL